MGERPDGDAAAETSMEELRPQDDLFEDDAVVAQKRQAGLLASIAGMSSAVAAGELELSF